MRCGPRSASAPARCQTGSWSAWPRWACCRRWPPSGRWSAWWMTSSGWTGPRRRRWGSWRGGWRPSRSAWSSRPGCRAQELAGLPELVVEGLPEEDARALLDSALTGPVDERVRDLIVAETRGNPLALLELPRGLSPAELAGGFGLPGGGVAAGADRGQLPAAARRPAGADPAAAAGGGGRSVRRPAAGVAGRRAAGDPGRGRWRRRPGRDWRSSVRGCGSGIRWRGRRPTGRRRFSRCRQVHAALAEATDPAG